MGHVHKPLEFTPSEYCSWTHRFDHPAPHSSNVHTYRTLYCAEQRVTCLREILDDFTPSAKSARDLAEALEISMEEAFREIGNQIPLSFFRDKAIAPARIRILSGSMVDIDDPGIRRRLEVQHQDFFEANAVGRFDISVARSRRRLVTRTMGYNLHQAGAAGIAYGSNIDDLRCFALFESQAELESVGAAECLADLLQEVEPVLQERNLVLGPA